MPACPIVRVCKLHRSTGQALHKDLREAGNEVAHGGETRNDEQISELTAYFTVGVGSGRLSILMVARDRIELPTRGFSVRCSTN
jgi:hypothetical protein